MKINNEQSFGISLAEYLTIYYPEILKEYQEKYNANECMIRE